MERNKELWYCVTYEDGRLDDGFVGGEKITGEDLDRIRQQFRDTEDETKTGIAVWETVGEERAAEFCVYAESKEEIEG